MTNIGFIAVALIGLIAATHVPSGADAQTIGGNSYKAQAAILSAGTRAAAIADLKAVGRVGVVDLKFNTRASGGQLNPYPAAAK